MPFRKRRRKRAYKKRAVRRYKKRKPHMTRMSWRKMGNISPDTLYTKLKYTATNTSSATAAFAYIYSLNSAFDPDVTGIGGQPLGFDQYSTLYNKYQVMGSKISVKMINDSTTVSILAALYPSTSSSPVTYSEGAEQKYSQWRYINNSHGANNMKTMSKYLSVRKLIGRNTNSQNFTALSSANPASRQYWIITGRSLDGIAAATAYFFVDITYYIKWFDRTALTAS